MNWEPLLSPGDKVAESSHLLQGFLFFFFFFKREQVHTFIYSHALLNDQVTFWEIHC